MLTPVINSDLSIICVLTYFISKIVGFPVSGCYCYPHITNQESVYREVNNLPKDTQWEEVEFELI